MRPRVFPAEDPLDTPDAAEARLASMRPRVFPAEDPYTGTCDMLARMLQ